MLRQRTSLSLHHCTIIAIIAAGIIIAAVMPSASVADSSSIEPLPGNSDPDSLTGDDGISSNPETTSDDSMADLLLWLVVILL